MVLIKEEKKAQEKKDKEFKNLNEEEQQEEVQEPQQELSTSLDRATIAISNSPMQHKRFLGSAKTNKNKSRAGAIAITFVWNTNRPIKYIPHTKVVAWGHIPHLDHH